MAENTFDQLNIISDDLDATVEFYRQLGLPMGEPARSDDLLGRTPRDPAAIV